MAELFENMEKLDIQAERRNTAEQKNRADTEKERADAEKVRADTAEQDLEAEIQKTERTTALLVETYQETGMTFEASCKKLMEKVGLNENEARIQISRYWK